MALISTGRHDVTINNISFGKSKTKGTPFLYLAFEDEDENQIGAWLYLSHTATPGKQSALAITTQTLRDAVGFDGNYQTIRQQLEGAECSIVVEAEEDQNGNERNRVKWINARGGGNGGDEIGDESDFLRSLTAQASRITLPPPRAGKAPSTRKDPF